MLLIVVALVLASCTGADGGSESIAVDEDLRAPRVVDGERPEGSFDPCGGPDHPCTLEEVPDEVIQRSQTLAGQALGQLDSSGGDLEAVAGWLDEQPEVVSVAVADDAVRFRIAGGRGTWLFPESAATVAGDPSLSGTPTPLGAPQLLGFAPRGGDPTVTVPGDGWNMPELLPVDTTTGGQPTTGKKALLLSPAEWEWQLQDVYSGVDELAEVIRQVRDYSEEHGGGVEVVKDVLVFTPSPDPSLPDSTSIQRNVNLAHWTSWDDYDYVYVLTHGAYACDGIRLAVNIAQRGTSCLTALATSWTLQEAWNELDRLEEAGESDSDRAALVRAAGVEISYGSFGSLAHRLPTGAGLNVWGEDSAEYDSLYDEREGNVDDGGEPFREVEREPTPGERNVVGPFLMLTSAFFGSAYLSGVSDAVIMLNACSSGRQPDLVDTLAGENSVVVGWSRIMRLSSAVAAADAFTRALLTTEPSGDPMGGLRAEAAMQAIQESVRSMVRSSSGGPTLTVDGGELTDVGTGARLGLSGDEDLRVREITYLLDAAGEELGPSNAITVDGQADDGEEDELVVVAQLDGVEADVDPRTFELSVEVDGVVHPLDADELRPFEPGVWRLEDNVPLGRDHSAGDLVDLEVVALLPEGGRSRWRYEQVPLGVGCGFQLTYAGTGTRPPEFSGAFGGVAAYTTNETGGGPTGLTSGAISVRVLPGDPPRIGPLLLSDQDPLTTILYVGYGPDSPGIPLGETGTFRLPVESAISPEGVAGWQPVGELEFTITRNEPEVGDNGELRLGVVHGTFRSVGALTYTSPFPEDGVAAEVTITDGTFAIDRAACPRSLL